MMFYKIIYNRIVIDAISEPRWVIWIGQRKQFMLTDKSTANGVVSSDCSEVYHIEGKKSFDKRTEKSKTVSVRMIDESEYHAIMSQKIDAIISESGSIISMAQLKSDKLNDISKRCEQSIMQGFDIVLSDGIQHHFSLKLTDQLKISKLNDKAVSGESFLPYHADDEPCKIYTAEDIIAINHQMECIIEYHTTYFNSLKIYINNMTDKNDIINLQYGDDIPENFQSDVLKIFVAQNSNGNIEI